MSRTVSFLTIRDAHASDGGNIYSFGWNTSGQTGYPEGGTVVLSPTRLSSLDGVGIRVAAGRLHSAVITGMYKKFFSIFNDKLRAAARVGVGPLSGNWNRWRTSPTGARMPRRLVA